jgi:hypothetical protein
MKADKEYIYYWYCHICDKEETYQEGFSNLKEARIELDKHEAEKHKKKQVGCYGKKVK